MTLSEKIGQMLFVGVSGAGLTAEMRQTLHHYKAGGIGLFSQCPAPKESNIQSPQQLTNLCRGLQGESTIPLFLAVDQEGGKISRLSEKNGFQRPPSPKKMGQDNSAGKEYRAIARTLAQCGVNMNFAPCCDVDTYPENPIIGALGRSFSSNEKTVLRCAQEAWLAQKKEGVLSCLKHFPGHGSSRTDTHLSVADVTYTFDDREWKPFCHLVAQGFDEFILTAHVIHRGISPLPASLAPPYPALLRRWGFEGVIITDDLNMGAIRQEFGLEEALILTFNAGTDMAAFFNNLAPYEPDLLPRVWEILHKAVEHKKIPLARIEESAARILHLKKRLRP